jgi:prepilin-type N-terminal cleavage/methylation domain-containing protein
MASSHINNLRGFSLTEVILSVALFSLISVSLVSAYVYVTQAFNRTALRSHAIDYAHEGVEAAALIAGRDMTNIPDGTYGLSYASNDWSLLGSSDTLGEYTRSITITSPTAESKRIVSTVNWKAGTI